MKVLYPSIVFNICFINTLYIFIWNFWLWLKERITFVFFPFHNYVYYDPHCILDPHLGKSKFILLNWRWWPLNFILFDGNFLNFYFLCYYRCPHPSFSQIHPALAPPPSGHHHTVVCVYRLCVHVLWLISSSSLQ